MSAHAGPAVRETCACGVAHRTQATWTKCRANTPEPEAPLRLAEVTAEHVRDALCTWGGRITYLRLGRDVLVFSGAWAVGELLVDRHDLVGMLAVYGGPEAAADVLTQDLRWEQTHTAVTA